MPTDRAFTEKKSRVGKAAARLLRARKRDRARRSSDSASVFLFIGLACIGAAEVTLLHVPKLLVYQVPVWSWLGIASGVAAFGFAAKHRQWLTLLLTLLLLAGSFLQLLRVSSLIDKADRQERIGLPF